ncbi:DUF3999 family protein [Orbaceae bacterium ac157xtp]
MKLKYCMLLLPLISASFSAFSSEQESPNDYAYGNKLLVTSEQVTGEQNMFSQIELPIQAYQQFTSPYLNDIRVFNHKGNSVPFAFVTPERIQNTIEKKSMEIYPLDKGEYVPFTSDYNINIEGKDININIDKPYNNMISKRIPYLLKMPDIEQSDALIEKLELQFAPTDRSWRATVNITYSDDLQHWQQYDDNVPLMNLTNNKEQIIRLTDINLNSLKHHRYWMLIIDLNNTPNTVLQLQHVDAVLKIKKENNNVLVPSIINLEKSDSKEAIYTLNSPRQAQTLRLTLPYYRSLLPVVIYYKSSTEQNEWTKLSETILRKTSYETNTDDINDIALNNKLIQQIKLTPLTGSFTNQELPAIEVLQNQVKLVFTSGNDTSFILAWGKANAKNEALPLSKLLSSKDDLNSIPTAQLAEFLVLKGENALTQQQSESFTIPKWVIWLGLIVIAGLLVLLAFKLLKEIKKN